MVFGEWNKFSLWDKVRFVWGVRLVSFGILHILPISSCRNEMRIKLIPILKHALSTMREGA